MTRKVVKWESDEEWALETRVFQCNETWPFDDVSMLLNDLWFQYCAAKEIEPSLDALEDAIIFFDKVKSASQEEQIAVGTDHWNRLLEAARNVVNEKEKIYD